MGGSHGRTIRAAAAAWLLALAGCQCGTGGDDATTCTGNADCPGGICLDGHCVSRDGGADGDATDDGGGDGDAGDEGGEGADAVCESGIPCGADCCAAGQRCAYGGCLVDLGPCLTNDDCAGDSYCDAEGRCTPYGTPPEVTVDPDC